MHRIGSKHIPFYFTLGKTHEIVSTLELNIFHNQGGVLLLLTFLQLGLYSLSNIGNLFYDHSMCLSGNSLHRNSAYSFPPHLLHIPGKIIIILKKGKM